MCKSMSSLEIALQLHGHFCPELLVGVRLAELAQKLLLLENGDAKQSALTAIAESPSCVIDALQAILGCTAGKGNLLIRNGSKKEYTIINQPARQKVVIQVMIDSQLDSEFSRFYDLTQQPHLTAAETIEKESLTGSLFETIMTSPNEQLFTWQYIDEMPTLSEKESGHLINTSFVCPSWPLPYGEWHYV